MKALPRAIETLIEAAGGVPDPIDTWESGRRYRHEDLLDYADEQLQAEQISVGIAWASLARLRWLSGDAEHALRWLSERRQLVAAEIARRGRR